MKKVLDVRGVKLPVMSRKTKSEEDETDKLITMVKNEIKVREGLIMKNSVYFLAAAFASFVLALLRFLGDQSVAKDQGIFVGLWVPSILSLGYYFKGFYEHICQYSSLDNHNARRRDGRDYLEVFLGYHKYMNELKKKIPEIEIEEDEDEYVESTL